MAKTLRNLYKHFSFQISRSAKIDCVNISWTMKILSNMTKSHTRFIAIPECHPAFVLTVKAPTYCFPPSQKLPCQSYPLKLNNDAAAWSHERQSIFDLLYTSHKIGAHVRCTVKEWLVNILIKEKELCFHVQFNENWNGMNIVMASEHMVRIVFCLLLLDWIAHTHTHTCTYKSKTLGSFTGIPITNEQPRNTKSVKTTISTRSRINLLIYW